MLPKLLLGADDDWIESFRRTWYPRFHGTLARFGGFGVAVTPHHGYALTLDTDEETLEQELVAAGFIRNPVAAYKTHTDGRPSEGSWVLLREEVPALPRDRQLHVTLFPSSSGSGIDLYAHEEYDWRVRPVAHLRSKDLNRTNAVEKVRRILDERTYFNTQ